MVSKNVFVKIFSHESDIDGLGSVILAKMVFKNVEYELFRDPQHLTAEFKKYIENNSLYQYDRIYVTDLSLYSPTIDMAYNDEKIREKLLIFDHHKGALDANCDKYDFSNVIIVDENGKKKCGTQLFYEYLYENNLIERNNKLDTFVELIRLEDTWEWTKQGEQGIKAHELSSLFNSMSLEEYISKMVTKLSNEEITDFEYDETEKRLIENKKCEIENAIQKALNDMEYLVDEFGNRFGAVFTNYEYRNDIPEYIRNSENKNEIKYVLIVAMDKGDNGQKSYRQVENGFDVNEVAKFHGGGGHVSAAIVSITAEQKENALKMEKKEALEYLAKCKFD